MAFFTSAATSAGTRARFRRITRSFYRGAHGVLVVFDTTKRSSFADLPMWIADARLHTSNAVCVLVGSKSDARAARQVGYAEARAFADAQGLAYIETSAKNDVNVDQAFGLLVRALMQRAHDVTALARLLGEIPPAGDAGAPPPIAVPSPVDVPPVPAPTGNACGLGVLTLLAALVYAV